MVGKDNQLQTVKGGGGDMGGKCLGSGKVSADPDAAMTLDLQWARLMQAA